MTTKKVRLVFDASTIHQSKKGSITSVIYFDFSDYQFPEKGWSDFVVIILTWWLRALKNPKENTELCFMDGSMLIRVKVLQNSELLLECINQKYEEENIEYQKYISLSEVKVELLEASKQVIETCRTKSIESDDLDDLIYLAKGYV